MEIKLAMLLDLRLYTQVLHSELTRKEAGSRLTSVRLAQMGTVIFMSATMEGGN